MTYERKKPLPENLRKKQERDTKRTAQVQADRQAAKQQAVKNKEYYYAQGKRYHEESEARRSDWIQAHREAKERGEILAEAESKVLLVVRIKGLNKVDPKRRKILQLLRLRQLHNAVIVRNCKPIQNMLKQVEAYVTYGEPSQSVIRQLIYARGFGKVNSQRIPLSSNYIVEEVLGGLGIRCMEDLINEVTQCGPNFKKANNFLWPFKLNSPKGGLDYKKTPYLNGGDMGPRGSNINSLVKRML
jgi:large subunit ribosomal protein L7e